MGATPAGHRTLPGIVAWAERPFLMTAPRARWRSPEVAVPCLTVNPHRFASQRPRPSARNTPSARNIRHRTRSVAAFTLAAVGIVALSAGCANEQPTLGKAPETTSATTTSKAPASSPGPTTTAPATSAPKGGAPTSPAPTSPAPTSPAPTSPAPTSDPASGTTAVPGTTVADTPEIAAARAKRSRLCEVVAAENEALSALEGGDPSEPDPEAAVLKRYQKALANVADATDGTLADDLRTASSLDPGDAGEVIGRIDAALADQCGQSINP